jgi:hypothetical protein
MPYRPRQERDRQRMFAAMRVAQAGNHSAMDRALMHIGVAFDEAAAVNGFKMRVERFVQLGPQHAATRARFGTRAAMLGGRDLDASLVAAERWWRDERKAFQIASALGFGNRLSLEVLRESRLILRLLRFRRMHAELDAAVAALRDETMTEAAE